MFLYNFWSQAKQIVLWKQSLKIKFCHHDFWNLQLLDTHVVLLAKNFLLNKFEQSLFLCRLTEQKRLFCYRWNATKILFSLFCWNENQAKLSMHFELQVSNLWTNKLCWNLTNLLSCTIVSCSKELCLQSLISFLIFEYFFTDICYPYLRLLTTKEQYYCNRQNLKIMHFCSQRCQDMNSILTNFCCLFKAGLDSNLQILLVLQKAVHFWNM